MSMKPISAWTATAQDSLASGTVIFERNVGDYVIKGIMAEYCFWLVAKWPNGGRVAFRAAYTVNDKLVTDNISETKGRADFSFSGVTGVIKVALQFPESDEAMFRYSTTITPAFDLLIPYWPRDIMPLFKKDGKVQHTTGTIHASQVGNRSGLLFFSHEYPQTGSVFYFQNLTALNKFCKETETPAGDLVGGDWPEIGMKLPVTRIDKPLKTGEEYTVSDAFVVLAEAIPEDNYQMSQQFLDYLAAVYLHLPTPATSYHDWPDFLNKGLNDLQNHKGCWKYADGQSYLNAYVSDYKTPPESMVQLAVLLPLLDYDKWSGEDHHPVIDTLRNGLEKFYDPGLGTLVRWLPAMEKNLDWSEEQKQPEVMDSWYLHHPLLNLSRMALDGDPLAKKLLMDSIEYVIKVARHFNYEWPVFYKMATLEVLKQETAEGMGGEKDVPGAYAHLMIQVWQLTGEKRYLDEAVKAAKKLDGLGFDIFYQANNSAFSAGALLRLYKETGDKMFLNISYIFIAAILKNVQLWECEYGNARHYPTFFAIYPLKDAPYTAAYEEQEVFAGIHTFLNEADGVDEILPSVKLLLAECIRYIINRVSYYYPPRLPREVIAEKEDIRMGEVDANLWVALEDLQDGWERSGQVGQEVYGAGIAFGIVPRQYYKVEKRGFMLFNEYPVTDFKAGRNSLTYFVRGNSSFRFRMMVLPLEPDKPVPKVRVEAGKKGQLTEITPENAQGKDFAEFTLHGDSHVKIHW
jgi:hypothetical protein